MRARSIALLGIGAIALPAAIALAYTCGGSNSRLMVHPRGNAGCDQVMTSSEGLASCGTLLRSTAIAPALEHILRGDHGFDEVCNYSTIDGKELLVGITLQSNDTAAKAAFTARRASPDLTHKVASRRWETGEQLAATVRGVDRDSRILLLRSHACMVELSELETAPPCSLEGLSMIARGIAEACHSKRRE